MGALGLPIGVIRGKNVQHVFTAKKYIASVGSSEDILVIPLVPGIICVHIFLCKIIFFDVGLGDGMLSVEVNVGDLRRVSFRAVGVLAQGDPEEAYFWEVGITKYGDTDGNPELL